MEKMRENEIKNVVLERYADIARSAGRMGCCGAGGCSTGQVNVDIGYSAEEKASAPDGADLGLGCGNPQAIASLKPGETVLDLGSGGGFDCFLAARQVGPEGRVIGVDMTSDMVELARRNADQAGVTNVEFRLGEIERLPLEDDSVGVIISNCVINLSPDKESVFREAFRVLAPGGRLAVSDVVGLAPLPEAIRNDLRLWASCATGASLITDLEEMLARVGFKDIRIETSENGAAMVEAAAPGRGLSEFIGPASIKASKPLG